MKKIFIAASLVVASLTVNAQEYKPTAGSVTAEVGINGGLLFTTIDLNDMGQGDIVNGQMKFRYFVADDIAARVGLAISKGSLTEFEPGANPGEEGEIKGSWGETLINLGVEKHLAGTDRLSTYVGLDLLLAFRNEKEKGTDIDVFGGGYNTGDSYESKGALQNSNVAVPAGFQGAGTGFGLRLVVGAEYYFVEKVYLGTEFGWGFLSQKGKEVELTGTSGGAAITPSTLANTPDKSSSITPSAVAAVRLGFRF